jgi:TrmH family RNA methyltransferase
VKLLTVARDLKRRRARERQTRFVAEGVRTVEELLRSPVHADGALVSPVLAATPRGSALLESVRATGMPVLEVDEKEFASASSTDSPQGILVVGEIPQHDPAQLALGDHARVLVLDGVQDPGNVGSMLRSAAAAGVAQVFMSQHCAFAWSPKVLRAGQGAHFHLAIFEGIDLGGWARAYRGKVVAMVAAEGTSLYDADLTGPVAIAIGNEGAGLSDDLVAAARSRVTIPMPGGFESLNAAAAAAISLYECVRQRSRGD